MKKYNNCRRFLGDGGELFLFDSLNFFCSVNKTLVLEMGSRKERFDNPIDRYQSLTIVEECLSKSYQYSFACKELSFFLKNAYSKFPKNLQSLIFQDTLFVFGLLPEIQTHSAILAANSLLQSAEFALPKQKRALAVTEHKHAVVASKRKFKTNKEEGLPELPQDVLVHIFGFLDVQSLLSASAVCQSWNAAAGDNCLWKLLYDTYSYNCDNVMENKGPKAIRVTKNVLHQTHNITPSGVNYRFAFAAAYKDACYGRFAYHRGYCSSCSSIVWLSRNRCPKETSRIDEGNHQIKPISIGQIVEFILDGVASWGSSSDSDSDTEDFFALGLWAYPKFF